MLGLRGQLLISLNMCKFKMKLIYNKEDFFDTKTKLLNFKLTLAVAKLEMISATLVSKIQSFQVIRQSTSR